MPTLTVNNFKCEVKFNPLVFTVNCPTGRYDYKLYSGRHLVLK